jgi:2,4-dienoyl-CoA reductase-like NADH-dependent reductase (Old Yellow Enzyme family)
MCQYSATDGFAADWHLVHYGARAAGGAGLILTEAAAVAADGRISSSDIGIWKDEHLPGLRRITDFIRGQGAAAGIQLAHAGRKAGRPRPWATTEEAADPARTWSPVHGPSPLRFAPDFPIPLELSVDAIAGIVEAFAHAAHRALAAGFDLVEVHAAHGYLLQEFLSPLSNRRIDSYGGSRENRENIVLEVIRAVRKAVGEDVPVLLRISAVDWMEGGFTLEDAVHLAGQAVDAGADLIDVSSGGNHPDAVPLTGPGYQTAFSAEIRGAAGVKTAAVGMITTATQADHIIRTGQADAVFLGRALLRDPSWALHAAKELGRDVRYPEQYLRGK